MSRPFGSFRSSRSPRLVAAFVLLAGSIAVGAFAARKLTLDASYFQGKDKQQAAAALIDAARELAGDGSYENIAVGRVLYLTGSRQEGQAIFDRVLAGKTKPGDWIRIARVYSEAGEWEKARPLYDRVVEAAPKDEDWLAEVGARYLIAGDRAHAEELFARSFAEDPANRSNALRAAAAYLGLAPRE